MAPVIKTISPADAERLLAGNTNNRSLNKAAVNRYAAAMARGEWRLGNDAICIAVDGRLLNGQHRCHAVILSQTTQQFLVREDVEPDDLKGMDQGNRRTGADIATLLGHPITAAQQRALRLLGTDWSFTTMIATPTVDMLIALEEEWRPYLDAASKTLLWHRRNAGIPTAAAAEALRWPLLEDRAPMIADFFSITWDNTPATDRPTDSKHADFIPCQLHRYVNSLAKGKNQLRKYTQYKVVVTCLHAYLTGASLTRSKFLDFTQLDVGPVNPFRA